MSKPVLLLVNSSFQLMCAFEFLLSHHTLSDVLIVSSENKDSVTFQQMMCLANDFGVESIESIALVNQGSLEDRIASYGDFYAKHIAQKTFEYVLVGDIRHQWMHDYCCSAKAQHVVMVDDGGAGLSIVKYILQPASFVLPISSTIPATESRQLLASQLKKRFGMELKPTAIKLFSIFHQQNSAWGKPNNFKQLVNFYNPTQTFNQIPEIHIIGAPFVEHQFFSQAAYMDYIQSLCALCKAYPKARLVYFMHRFELNNSLKMAALEDMGFELRQSKINYELGLIQAATRPMAVASILSTSLFNVKALFAEQIDAFFAPLKPTDLEAYLDAHWMVKHYTLAQHWQNIIENFPVYSIEPITSRDGKACV